MNWYINDLSLDGKFTDPYSFREKFEPLVRLMNTRGDLRGRVFCSRDLSFRPVTDSHNLAQAIRATQDQLFISLVLRWIIKTGPFWEQDRTSNEDDLFHFEAEDVTEQGLGEAARRLAVNLPAGTFSLVRSPHDRFAATGLSVIHGFPEQPFGVFDVTNCCEVGSFPEAREEPVVSWKAMIDRAGRRCPG